MTKTFKLSGIFLISVVSLQLFRILFYYIPFSDNISGWLFSLLFQVGCLGLIPYFLYRAFITKDRSAFVKDFSLNVKIPALCWPFAFIIGLLVFILNTGISSTWYVLLDFIGFTHISAPGTIFSSPEVLIMEIITSAMLPAVFEEFTDRGLLLAVLGEERDDTKKILIVGVMFGFLHQNVAQLTPTMFGGFVMAFMAVKSGSIVPGMIVHFMNNFLITLLQYSSQLEGGFGYFADGFYGLLQWNPLATLVCYLLAMGLLVVILRKYDSMCKKTRAELYPEKNTAATPASPPVDVFEDVFGTADGSRPAPAPVIKADPTKVGFKNYVLLYCALISAAAVTLFTFIWGLWR